MEVFERMHYPSNTIPSPGVPPHQQEVLLTCEPLTHSSHSGCSACHSLSMLQNSYSISGPLLRRTRLLSSISNSEPTQSYKCNSESAMAGEITGYGVLESSPHPAYAACVGMSSTYFLPLAQPWFVVAEIVSPVDEVNVADPTPHLEPELGECSVKA